MKAPTSAPFTNTELAAVEALAHVRDDRAALAALRARFPQGPLAAHVAGLLARDGATARAIAGTSAARARHQQRADLLRNVLVEIATVSRTADADIKAAREALAKDDELRARQANEAEAAARDAAIIAASVALRRAEVAYEAVVGEDLAPWDERFLAADVAACDARARWRAALDAGDGTDTNTSTSTNDEGATK